MMPFGGSYYDTIYLRYREGSETVNSALQYRFVSSGWRCNAFVQKSLEDVVTTYYIS